MLTEKQISKRADYAKYRNGKGSYYKANVGSAAAPVYTTQHFKYAAYAQNYAKAAKTIDARNTRIAIAVSIIAVVAAIAQFINVCF